MKSKEKKNSRSGEKKQMVGGWREDSARGITDDGKIRYHTKHVIATRRRRHSETAAAAAILPVAPDPCSRTGRHLMRRCTELVQLVFINSFTALKH